MTAVQQLIAAVTPVVDSEGRNAIQVGDFVVPTILIVFVLLGIGRLLSNRPKK